MLVFALVSVYFACGAVLLSVLLQDRAKASGARRRRAAGGRDPRATHTPELVFRTHG